MATSLHSSRLEHMATIRQPVTQSVTKPATISPTGTTGVAGAGMARPRVSLSKCVRASKEQS